MTYISKTVEWTKRNKKARVENVSSFPQIYNVLHNAFDAVGHGDYIKSEFPCKGIASLADTGITLAATEAIAAAKSCISNKRNG